jgi:hypothetical protein
MDSLSIEVNSLLKIVFEGDSCNGILGKWYAKLAAIVLLPVSIAVRIIIPSIRPSIQITATKC